MSLAEHLRRLSAHDDWADARILGALRQLPAPPPAAMREFAHVLGAREVWLARIEGRVPLVPVWPDLPLTELASLADGNSRRHRALLDRLTEADLRAPVSYTNSAGIAFVTPLDDILLHVAMHGQYHRGKVNLALRDAGLPPVPTDYIAFVRGAPAATTSSPAP
ncbi:MAG: DinB family protein [Gemmatimonadaceae bacterium]